MKPQNPPPANVRHAEKIESLVKYQTYFVIGVITLAIFVGLLTFLLGSWLKGRVGVASVLIGGSIDMILWAFVATFYLWFPVLIEHRANLWRKRFPLMTVIERFPVHTAAGTPTNISISFQLTDPHLTKLAAINAEACINRYLQTQPLPRNIYEELERELDKAFEEPLKPAAVWKFTIVAIEPPISVVQDDDITPIGDRLDRY